MRANQERFMLVQYIFSRCVFQKWCVSTLLSHGGRAGEWRLRNGTLECAQLHASIWSMKAARLYWTISFCSNITSIGMWITTSQHQLFSRSHGERNRRTNMKRNWKENGKRKKKLFENYEIKSFGKQNFEYFILNRKFSDFIYFTLISLLMLQVVLVHLFYIFYFFLMLSMAVHRYFRRPHTWFGKVLVRSFPEQITFRVCNGEKYYIELEWKSTHTNGILFNLKIRLLKLIHDEKNGRKCSLIYVFRF